MAKQKTIINQSPINKSIHEFSNELNSKFKIKHVLVIAIQQEDNTCISTNYINGSADVIFKSLNKLIDNLSN